MRPFNFETFATTAYVYASQDLIEAAAVTIIISYISWASVLIFFSSKYILSHKNNIIIKCLKHFFEIKKGHFVASKKK